MVLSTGPLKMTATLAAGCLSNLQLAIECMHLCHDIEDVCVGLVVGRVPQPTPNCPCCGPSQWPDGRQQISPI